MRIPATRIGTTPVGTRHCTPSGPTYWKSPRMLATSLRGTPVPVHRKRLPPEQVRPELMIESNVVVGAMGDMEEVNHMPQERSSWPNHLACMLQDADEGLLLLANLASGPQLESGSHVFKLVLGKAEDFGLGIDLDPQKREARYRALQLVHGEWNAEVCATLRTVSRAIAHSGEPGGPITIKSSR